MNLPVWILLTICILGWGFWGVLEKMAIRDTSVFLVQLFGTIVFLTCVLISYLFNRPEGQLQFTYSGMLWASLASISSFLAGISCLRAMKNLDTNYVVGITSASPIVTFILCALILGENITILKMVGIVIVVIGIIFVGI